MGETQEKRHAQTTTSWFKKQKKRGVEKQTTGGPRDLGITSELEPYNNQKNKRGWWDAKTKKIFDVKQKLGQKKGERKKTQSAAQGKTVQMGETMEEEE